MSPQAARMLLLIEQYRLAQELDFRYLTERLLIRIRAHAALLISGGY